MGLAKRFARRRTTVDSTPRFQFIFLMSNHFSLTVHSSEITIRFVTTRSLRERQRLIKRNSPTQEFAGRRTRGWATGSCGPLELEHSRRCFVLAHPERVPRFAHLTSHKGEWQLWGYPSPALAALRRLATVQMMCHVTALAKKCVVRIDRRPLL